MQPPKQSPNQPPKQSPNQPPKQSPKIGPAGVCWSRGRSGRPDGMKLRLLIGLLVALNGAWMAFDGGRALVAGDYVTPSSGPYAGQLGPWAAVVRAVGLAPRSTVVKIVFVAYGAAVAGAAAAFAGGRAGARRALLVLLPLGLWYVPFGTAINLGALVAIVRAGRQR